MTWLQHPIILESENVRLEPLTEHHFPALIEIAKNPQIWDQMPIDGTNSDRLVTELRSSILKRYNQEVYPFAIIDKKLNKVIGMTRYFDINFQYKKLEIGFTWYDPEHWGTGFNTECKLLMLTYCFETLKTQRVQIKTRNSNIRSQKAILKIGCTFEGRLRKDRISRNGEPRDTMMYSIIDDEWPIVKNKLLQMVSC